jgi:hypothetical protein
LQKLLILRLSATYVAEEIKKNIGHTSNQYISKVL